MAEDGVTKKGVDIKVEVSQGGAQDAILHVSYFRFTQIGSEVILEVGNIDHQGMHKVLRNPDAERVVKASVLQRFGMSIEAFDRLKGNVDQLWEMMQRSGGPEAEPQQSTSE